MSDRIYVGSNVKDLDISKPSDIITKVVLIYTSDNGDTTSIEVGDNTGKTLEVNVPWGNEEMAQSILDKVSNYQYRAYTAKQASVNPAAELGDGVTIGNTFSGIFHQETDFQFIDAPDIESPYEEESDNEYKYESPQNREFTRHLSALGSRITQTAEYIQSEVYTKDETDNEISSQVRQEIDSWSVTFNNTLNNRLSWVEIVDDPEHGATIVIGTNTGNIKLIEYSDRVAFIDSGGNELAYISPDGFFMPNATVTKTMNFGGYQADARSVSENGKGGIIWKWVGR